MVQIEGFYLFSIPCIHFLHLDLLLHAELISHSGFILGSCITGTRCCKHCCITLLLQVTKTVRELEAAFFQCRFNSFMLLAFPGIYTEYFNIFFDLFGFCLFLRIVFADFFIMNLILWVKGSSAAIPFGTLVAILAMWFGISVPLTFVGAYFGFKEKVGVFEYNYEISLS